MAELILPVSNYRGLSSWQAHINRGTPSSEPGTDLYVPIGTPVRAPADGTIWGSGESIGPATGRWVGIDFDNGMGFRTMHHSRNLITGGRVLQGDVYALSGASGYGEEDWSWNVAETGGAHVHATLWPTHEHRYGYRSPGVPFTIDLMRHVSGTTAGGSNTFEEDDMFDDNDREALAEIRRAIGAAGYMDVFKTDQEQADASVLAHVRAAVTLLNAIRAEQANTNGYLFRGGPSVDGLEGAPGSIFGRLVALAGGATADVDEEALAVALAPLLNANTVVSLPDAELERLATALVDEQAKRLARSS